MSIALGKTRNRTLRYFSADGQLQHVMPVLMNPEGVVATLHDSTEIRVLDNQWNRELPGFAIERLLGIASDELTVVIDDEGNTYLGTFEELHQDLHLQCVSFGWLPPRLRAPTAFRFEVGAGDVFRLLNRDISWGDLEQGLCLTFLYRDGTRLRFPKAGAVEVVRMLKEGEYPL